ncbi:MAG: matrixin family metalloprotease [Cyanobacteria bacterium]|nr:matrixin family metalloprotease [Cyanobacteriota bacterium]
MLAPTYLDQCLKEGLLVRWPDSAMPIKVYIAPFRWYETAKQRASTLYEQMILEAMSLWSTVSQGKIRFQRVTQLTDSQIDVKWRRVDRTSLGHCQYLINDQGMMYSAEIQIGISDGIIHARYNNMNEVKHTIVHEFGHALGLVGHSNHNADIMFVPHQFGVVSISQRDVLTLNQLYSLPPGFDFQAQAHRLALPAPYTLFDVLDKLHGDKSNISTNTAQEKLLPENPDALHHQQSILTEMGKFHLATQHIKSPLLPPHIAPSSPKINSPKVDDDI